MVLGLYSTISVSLYSVIRDSLLIQDYVFLCMISMLESGGRSAKFGVMVCKASMLD